MNWTGGCLQRHKGQAGSLAAKQKQHFAKVQANRGPVAKKRSPIKWDVFEHAIPSRETSGHPPVVAASRDRFRSDRSSRGVKQRYSHLACELGERSPSPQSTTREHETRIEQEACTSAPNDQYMATPDAYHTERGKVESSELLDTTSTLQDSTSNKRRRLLQKGDWAGMSLLRSSISAFVPSRNDENVGRRRIIKDHHRPKYYQKLQNHISPFTVSRRPLLLQDENLRVKGTSDVRISIDGKVIATGASSSLRGRRLSTHSASHNRASSDVMLLDSQFADVSRSDNNEGSLGHTDSKYKCPSPTTSDSSERLSIASGAPVNSSTGTTNPSTQMVAISSLASIHQPTPRSYKLSVLLRSSSENVAQSTLAQVGAYKPAVPSSQQLDNEVWETWILSERGPSFSTSDDGERLASISPGVSCAAVSPQPESCQRDLVSSIGNSRWLQESKDKGSLRSTSRVSSSMQPQEFSLLVPKHDIEQYETFRRGKKTPIEHLRDLPEKKLPAATKPTQLTEGDLDGIWRKFVFDSSSDEGDGLHKQNASLFLGQPPLSKSDSTSLVAPFHLRSVSSSLAEGKQSKAPAAHGTSKASAYSTSGASSEPVNLFPSSCGDSASLLVRYGSNGSDSIPSTHLTPDQKGTIAESRFSIYETFDSIPDSISTSV